MRLSAIILLVVTSVGLSIAAETNTTWTDGTSIWYYPGGVQTAVPSAVFGGGTGGGDVYLAKTNVFTAPTNFFKSVVISNSLTINTNLTVSGTIYGTSTGATYSVSSGTSSNALAVGGTAAASIARRDITNTFTGNQTATLVANGNVQLGTYWLSGDGGNEGITVASDGDVGIQCLTPTASARLQIAANAGGTNFAASITPTDCLILAGTNVTTASIAAYIGSDTATHRPLFKGVHARGTLASPTATAAGDNLFGFAGGAFDGYSVQFNGLIQFENSSVTAVSSNVAWGDVVIYLGKNGTRSERVRFATKGDIRMANMTEAPTTGSGYGYIGASNSEVYVWDGSGNRTLLSAENEWGEMIRRTEKPMAGFAEEYNQTLAGQMLEELAASLDAKTDVEIKAKYKGRIYRKWAIEATDWRENEQRQATERAKQIASWDAEATRYTSALVAWQESPNKGKTPQPEPPDQGDRPSVYVPRPVPSWATNAQSRFDAKWKDSPK